MFRPTSRYYNQQTSVFVDRDGRARVYVVLREVPQPGPPSVVDPIHVVVDHDRLDNVAARHLGDPELFWRLCDANAAMLPDELTAVPGRRLRVPLDHRPPQP